MHVVFVLSLFSCVFLFILWGNFYYSQGFNFSAPRRGSLIPFYALSSWQGIPGLPDLGVVNFFAYVFSFLFFFCLIFFVFFQSPCKRLKISHHSVHPGSTIVEGCNWGGVVTIAPFHLAHVSLTANHVRSSRILSPSLFRSASPVVPSPCGERWENAHLRIWLCH